MKGDRGTTIVDAVIGLFLIAMAAAVLAQLMTSTARSVPSDTLEPDAALAVDVFSRDVRESTGIETESAGGRATAVLLHVDTATTRWELDNGSLLRSDDSGRSPRVMATGIDPTSEFLLRDSTGEAIAPADAEEIRWCTRLVELALVGDGWDMTRATVLRVDMASERCP